MKLLHWLVASLAVLALGACGGDALSLEAQVANAATKTSEAQSMRVAMTMRMTMPEVGPMEIDATGVVDGATRRARMTMELPEVEGEELGSLTTLMIDLDIYMQMEFLRRQAPELKPWIKIDLQKIGKEVGFDFQALMQAGQSDPTQTLDYLRASGKVEEIGEEEVRGVETTRYRAVVDLEKAVGQLRGPRAKAAARSLRQAIRLTGPRTIPMDVWIDDESLVRRMRWSQAIPAETGRSKMSITMEMFDFGVRANITPPPAKDVMTLDELLMVSKP